jgi:flagellar FliJ protein
MKRFAFRLQRVLDIRSRIRDERRQELGARQAELQREEALLAELEAELLLARIEEGGTYSASELQMVGAYAIRLRSQIERQLVRIEGAKQAVEEARARYIEATKDTQVLEKLREKRREEYTQEVLLEEGRNLDEVAVQRFKRGE